ncbi:MAG: DNA polymerase IV [Clostridia bacterium]
MDRVILHSDANSFYISVESVYQPKLWHVPAVVAGCVEERHGIILTKNQLAKRYGIQTGQAIWQAKQQCPDLVCVPPDYELYVRFSKRLRQIYEEYSDRVESFGLDEAWIDLTNPGVTIADGERIAHEIRNRIHEELGITVSVGVSFNKIFAKLGSDYKKPDAVTVISRENYQQIVHPLPVQDLLYVGRSTQKKLNNLNVRTIGDLAHLDANLVNWNLGKVGLMLKCYAMGADQSPVMPTAYSLAVKSVGNSTTPPHDLTCMEDARCIFFLLAESVAARLRDGGFVARCISISARTTTLVTNSRQQTLSMPTNLSGEIAATAIRLFDDRFAKGFPYRSVGISCSGLMPDTVPVQLDLLDDERSRMRQLCLEKSIDGLRKRFGHQVIQRGVVLQDRGYAKINPVDEHTIHPVPFFAG